MAGDQPEKVQMMQVRWLTHWYRHQVSRWGGGCRDSLEVGCGSGHVMDVLADLMDVQGIDIDPVQVSRAVERGHEAVKGDGLELQMKDGSFDMVYSSYYLMWSGDLRRALSEMLRVARRKVLVMAEPIYGAAVVDPPDLKEHVSYLSGRMLEEGGNPDAGLELLSVVEDMDVGHTYGTIPWETSLSRVSETVEMELSILGEEYSGKAPRIFYIPTIWAVLDVQDDIRL